MTNFDKLLFTVSSLLLLSCSTADKTAAVISAPAAAAGIDITVIDADEVIDPDNPKWTSVVNTLTAKFSACTATLIGKDTMLTAAHCVDKNNTTGPTETVEVMIRIEDHFHIFDCSITDEYRNGAYAGGSFRSPFDVALCKSITPNRLPARLTYENLDLTSTRTRETEFYFGGYGCFYKNGVFDPGDGKLRIGSSKIGNLIDAERRDYNQFGYFRTSTPLNDGNADICQGDSGGPTFSTNDAIIAVLSGGAKKPNGEWLSRFVDLSHPTNKRFITDWLSANNDNYICGVSDPFGSTAHREAGCRNSPR